MGKLQQVPIPHFTGPVSGNTELQDRPRADSRGREPKAKDAATEGTKPWDGGVRGASGMQEVVIETDSATGSGGVRVCQCPAAN